MGKTMRMAVATVAMSVLASLVPPATADAADPTPAGDSLVEMDAMDMKTLARKLGDDDDSYDVSESEVRRSLGDDDDDDDDDEDDDDDDDDDDEVDAESDDSRRRRSDDDDDDDEDDDESDDSRRRRSDDDDDEDSGNSTCRRRRCDDDVDDDDEDDDEDGDGPNHDDHPTMPPGNNEGNGESRRRRTEPEYTRRRSSDSADDVDNETDSLDDEEDEVKDEDKDDEDDDSPGNSRRRDHGDRRRKDLVTGVASSDKKDKQGSISRDGRTVLLDQGGEGALQTGEGEGALQTSEGGSGPPKPVVTAFSTAAGEEKSIQMTMPQNLAAYDRSSIMSYLAQAAGESVDDLFVETFAAEIVSSYEVDDSVTTVQMATAVAQTVGVSTEAVEVVSAARRLSSAERRLAPVTYAVKVKTGSMDDAPMILMAASNMTLLAEKIHAVVPNAPAPHVLTAPKMDISVKVTVRHPTTTAFDLGTTAFDLGYEEQSSGSRPGLLLASTAVALAAAAALIYA